MNIEEVKKHINYLRCDKYDKEFYVALLLYDIAGLHEKDITEEYINKAYEIFDDYDSIYKEEIRYEVQDELYRVHEDKEEFEEEIC